MKNSYRTVEKPAESLLIEKKSRFIALVQPLTEEKEAIASIEAARKKYYDASHVVYAYKLRQNNTARFSDAGEPQGTAGVPVLEVINKEGLTDISVTVVRYFGGALLGAGGLVRAYGKSAHDGIAAAGIVTMSECAEFELICPYNMFGKIEYTLLNNSARKSAVEYGENIRLKYFCETADFAKISAEITDASNGSLTVTETGRRFMRMP
jgi:uncharacterized YigZ family protein